MQDAMRYFPVGNEEEKFPLARTESYPGRLFASSAALELAPLSGTPPRNSYLVPWTHAFQRSRNAQALADVVRTSRSFIFSTAKAKTARLIRSLLDLFSGRGPPRETSIDGVSSSLPKPARPAPRSPQLTGSLPASSSTLLPPLLPQDRAKFIKLFNGSGPVNGVLAGDKAQEIFLKSKLPYEKLSQIWNMADTRSRGALDSTDFIIAMYLIQASMSNQLPVLPPTLPAGLYEAASGGVASHSTGTSSLGAASPTAPAFRPAVQPPPPKPIMRNTTGSRPPPPPIPARSAFPLAQQQPQWDVTPQEKAQFDAFFDQLDTQKTGFAGGDVVGPFLQESTLPDDTLAQIWDLVDSRGEGRLSREQFAVVMHLINNKLAGKEVPAVLPPTLVPPSMRVASLGASAFGQAAFQQHQQPIQPPQPQKDLFSLDDTPPPSAVQAPLQPQLTGALAQQMTGQSLPRQTTGPQHPSAFGAPSSFSTPAAASSPFGQPAFTPQAQASPFGQPAADPYAAFNQLQQHRPAPPPPQPHKDLLGDEEDEAAAAAAAQNLQTSAEIGNIQNQLSSTNRTLETTRQDRESLEKSIEANASQLAALQTQLASAKASYETESKLLATFRDKYAEQTKEITKTREELIAAESDLSAIKLEKTEVGGAALRDKDEVRALQKRMKEVGDEVDALKAELEKAKKDARQQKGLLAIAKKQLAAAEENRARAAKELEEAQAEVAADKAELDDVNQAIEKLNAAAAVAPIPAAAAPKPAIAQMPVEEAAIPLPPTATATPVPVPAGKSLNPFEKLVRQDSVSGTPPRVMSPFGSLPFTAAAIPTPPIGPDASSPPPVATQMTGASAVAAEPAPLSAAGDDPFGLDKFDEVFSTPTENIASPLHAPPPEGVDRPLDFWDDFVQGYEPVLYDSFLRVIGITNWADEACRRVVLRSAARLQYMHPTLQPHPLVNSFRERYLLATFRPSDLTCPALAQVVATGAVDNNKTVQDFRSFWDDPNIISMTDQLSLYKLASSDGILTPDMHAHIARVLPIQELLIEAFAALVAGTTGEAPIDAGTSGTG
ncbi:hypothetical protein AURDEDRAFT_157906 [Auricularia subglabra TFB-10046 SS5]|nr:hypothetical protein AURDEDRAFT_157906 [Auricularia subglabra TFB-10046 SS5]